jgi:hypothetical protein
MDRSSPPSTPLQQLLHRWFVQYNPIYLVSAMLVIGGMITTSRGLAHEGSLYGPLGVALIAELYACSLIAGAALLTRIGQRRPAVMLALLTVLYQSDLTLHTETCAFLGTVGIVASIAWFAFFMAKLLALAWALRVRIAPRALATAALGALALTIGPHVLGRLDATSAGAALAIFVFVLGTIFPRGDRQIVTSFVQLDDWSQKVLGRTVRATWIVWGVLLALHVLFWSTQHPIQLGAVVPAFALLAMRRVRTETRVWVAVVSALVLVLVVAPQVFSMCCLLATLGLVQRAFSRVPAVASPQGEAPVAHDPSPYRMREHAYEDAERTRAVVPIVELVPVSAAERVRLLSGALFGVYLAAWTFGWAGGDLPAHVLPLDLTFAALVAFMVWRLRARLVLAPLAAMGMHALFAARVLSAPRSLVGWGATTVVIGFVLLLASLVTSYRLRHVTQAGPSNIPDQ